MGLELILFLEIEIRINWRKRWSPETETCFSPAFGNSFHLRSQCQYVLIMRKSAQMRGIAIAKGCTRGKEVHT